MHGAGTQNAQLRRYRENNISAHDVQAAYSNAIAALKALVIHSTELPEMVQSLLEEVIAKNKQAAAAAAAEEAAAAAAEEAAAAAAEDNSIAGAEEGSAAAGAEQEMAVSDHLDGQQQPGNVVAAMDRVSSALATLNGNVTALTGRMAAVEGRLGAVEGAVSAVQGALSALDGRVGAVEVELRGVQTSIGKHAAVTHAILHNGPRRSANAWASAERRGENPELTSLCREVQNDDAQGEQPGAMPTGDMFPKRWSDLKTLKHPTLDRLAVFYGADFGQSIPRGVFGQARRTQQNLASRREKFKVYIGCIYD